MDNLTATPEWLKKHAQVMRLVQEDCETEAIALDGAPFNGRTVAEQFGNILAEIAAVAKAVEVLTTLAACQLDES